MSEPLARPRRLGVASLATLAVATALSVAAPTALIGSAHAAERHNAPLAPGVSAPGGSHTQAAARSMSVQASQVSFENGTVLVADYGNQRVVAIAPGGAQTTVGSGFAGPSGVALDAATGEVYVADYGANLVYKIAQDGTQTTVGSDLSQPEAVLIEPDGDLLISDANNQRVLRVTPEGDQTVLPFTGLQRPYGLAEDADGDIFVADAWANSVYKLTPGGDQSAVGGDYNFPSDVALDSAGDLIVTDAGSDRVLKVTADGAQQVLPFTDLAEPFGVGVDAQDNVFVANLNAPTTYELTSDGQSTVGEGVGGAGVDVASRPGQVISFTSDAPEGALPGDGYTVSATGGDSGNPVTFSTGSDGVCTVMDNGDSTADVSLDHAGDCVIDADQAGTKNFSAAPQAHQTVTVGMFTQGIAFTSDAPEGALPGDGYTVSATGGDSENPVTFSTGSDGVCTVTDNGDSTADVSLDHAGDCVIDADQAGNSDYSDAPQAHQTVTVGMFAQGIAFNSDAPEGALPGDGYTVSATGGDSGNPVTFSTQSSDVCTVTDNGDSTADVSLDHAGDCVIDADQAGNGDYLAAEQAHQTVTTGQIAQPVTFTSAPGVVRSGDSYTATATGGDSGNPVTFAVDKGTSANCTVSPTGDVQFLHAKTCTVVASQAGDGDYLDGSATQTITVRRAIQTVEFTSKAPHKPRAGTTYHATASGNPTGGRVRITGVGACSIGRHGVVTFNHSGSCTVFATQAANADHQPGKAKQFIVIRPRSNGRGFGMQLG
jgi:hypothetical protein